MHATTSVPGGDGFGGGGIDYIAVDESPKFQALKRTQRSFIFPMAVFFVLWYLAFVILGAFFPEVMAIPVFGYVNVGLLLGLGQFVTTFVITMWYVRFANTKLDPVATEFRAELEAAEEQK